MAQTQPQKLNISQRGILQKVATVIAYFASFAVGAFILDWLEKRRFTVVAEKAQQQGILTSEGFRDFRAQIAAMDETAIFAIIIVGLFCVGIGWLLMRWAANLNWSWPVTLPRAVEFRFAMRMLNITGPAGEIECIRKHKPHIFIALAPMRQQEQEAVRARLYAFAHDMFSRNDVFERHIGKQTLCLDAAEYELLAEKVKKEESLRESVVIAAKDEEIKGLRTAVASLTQENAVITKERDELRGKVRIQSAQEEGRVKRLRIERLLWIAYSSVIDRLMRDIPPAKGYTTPDIEAAFAAEWEQRADLREHMRQLTGIEEANPSEDFIKAVKAEFKEVGKLNTGSRPRKNP
ncbi:MAG: hypothetical protein LBC94_00060 [Desulfovibrio sp.]|jgi:hypothetical protein|nr:hypothetical protein [Desulfovibrio sp.]